MSETRHRTATAAISDFMPKYFQVKQHLQQRMGTGELAPHDKLPSEAELIRIYNISRITARHAIQELIRAGFVYSIQGKGSFVNLPDGWERTRETKRRGDIHHDVRRQRILRSYLGGHS